MAAYINILVLWSVLSVTQGLAILEGTESCEGTDWYLNPDQETGTGCYFISRDARTNNDSADFCASHDARLAIIPTSEEHHFIRQHLLNETNYWIGLRKTNTESAPEEDWEWEDGTTYSWTNWVGRKPTSDGNCGYIYSPTGEWRGKPCLDAASYNRICEKIPPTTAAPTTMTQTVPATQTVPGGTSTSEQDIRSTAVLASTTSSSSELLSSFLALVPPFCYALLMLIV